MQTQFGFGPVDPAEGIVDALGRHSVTSKQLSCEPTSSGRFVYELFEPRPEDIDVAVHPITQQRLNWPSSRTQIATA